MGLSQQEAAWGFGGGQPIPLSTFASYVRENVTGAAPAPRVMTLDTARFRRVV